MTNAHHRGLLKRLQGQGDFPSVFTSRTGHSSAFPNNDNFISYRETSTQVYYKKTLVQTEAGTTWTAPKRGFTYPASRNTAHRAALRLPQPELPPRTADGRGKPTFASRCGGC